MKFINFIKLGFALMVLLVALAPAAVNETSKGKEFEVTQSCNNTAVSNISKDLGKLNGINLTSPDALNVTLEFSTLHLFAILLTPLFALFGIIYEKYLESKIRRQEYIEEQTMKWIKENIRVELEFSRNLLNTNAEPFELWKSAIEFINKGNTAHRFQESLNPNADSDGSWDEQRTAVALFAGRLEELILSERSEGDFRRKFGELRKLCAKELIPLINKSMTDPNEAEAEIISEYIKMIWKKKK